MDLNSKDSTPEERAQELTKAASSLTELIQALTKLQEAVSAIEALATKQ